MNVDILHLSDLHFGNPARHLRRRDVAQALDTLFSLLTATTSLVIVSGDITFQGRKEGHIEAADALAEAIDRQKLERTNVFLCPGNHDLVRETDGVASFASFDICSALVRRDKRCTFTGNSAQLIEHSSADILLLNSAHHLDHQFGLVDIPEVDRLLKTLPSEKDSRVGRLRLAVIHHHMIPVLSEDVSAIRNSYPLLTRLQRHGFSALLHGHQHALLGLNIGDSNMLLSGVGSFGFSTPGFINSAAIYRCSEGSIQSAEHFGLSLDASSGVVRISKVDGEPS